MADAYIVDAVRTAGGRRGGRLAGWPPVGWGAGFLDSISVPMLFYHGGVENLVLGASKSGGW